MKSSRKGESDDEDEYDVAALLEDLAVKSKELSDLRIENDALKREVDCWHRRAERAEKEAVKWKATADEWKGAFTKRTADGGRIHER
jgi:septal ring factor EnvC (AmiA/AmiB activator)